MRSPQYFPSASLLGLSWVWLFAMSCAPDRSFGIVEAPATFAVLATPPSRSPGFPAPDLSVSFHPLQKTVAPEVDRGAVKWIKTKATFYGDPYDDGRRRVCADNKTVYKSDGAFCAAWTGGSGSVLPLGAVIEVRRLNVTLTLTVTDRQKYRSNRLLDLPTKTWDKFGAKRSTGKIAVEWRRIK